MILKEES